MSVEIQFLLEKSGFRRLLQDILQEMYGTLMRQDVSGVHYLRKALGKRVRNQGWKKVKAQGNHRICCQSSWSK